MNNLKSSLIKIKDDPLTRGATILFIGSLGVNFASYLYNLVVGRMLGPVQYGEYLSLITIVYLVSIPFSPAQTVVVKYVSELKAKQKITQIKSVLILLTKYISFLTMIVTIGLIVAIPFIQSTLKIENTSLIVLTALTFAAFNPTSLLVAAFSGLERFVEGTVLSAIGIIIRIVLSVLAIELGYSVGGVFIAIIIGSIVSYALSWEVMLGILSEKQKKIKILSKIKTFIIKLVSRTDKDLAGLKKEIVKYTIPVAIASIGVTAITQLDIILVKTYFSAYDAGIYSSLAIIGKVIPFFTLPLLSAMFPQLVARITKGEDFLKPFYAILSVIVVFSLSLSAVYFFFPELVIKLFFGKNYLAAAPLIGTFGLFQTAYAVLNAYINFFMAIGRNKLAVQSIIAVILQVICISLFHDSLLQVIQISALICGLFVIYFSICTLHVAYSSRRSGYVSSSK